MAMAIEDGTDTAISLTTPEFVVNVDPESLAASYMSTQQELSDPEWKYFVPEYDPDPRGGDLISATCRTCYLPIPPEIIYMREHLSDSGICANLIIPATEDGNPEKRKPPARLDRPLSNPQACWICSIDPKGPHQLEHFDKYPAPWTESMGNSLCGALELEFEAAEELVSLGGIMTSAICCLNCSQLLREINWIQTSVDILMLKLGNLSDQLSNRIEVNNKPILRHYPPTPPEGGSHGGSQGSGQGWNKLTFVRNLSQLQQHQQTERRKSRLADSEASDSEDFVPEVETSDSDNICSPDEARANAAASSARYNATRDSKLATTGQKNLNVQPIMEIDEDPPVGFDPSSGQAYVNVPKKKFPCPLPSCTRRFKSQMNADYHVKNYHTHIRNISYRLAVDESKDFVPSGSYKKNSKNKEIPNKEPNVSKDIEKKKNKSAIEDIKSAKRQHGLHTPKLDSKSQGQGARSTVKNPKSSEFVPPDFDADFSTVSSSIIAQNSREKSPSNDYTSSRENPETKGIPRVETESTKCEGPSSWSRFPVPVPCPITNCTKIFSFRQAMNRHIQAVHHPELLFLHCALCGKKFRKSQNEEETKKLLNDHEALHNENSNPFSCVINACAEVFRTSFALRMHVRVHEEDALRCEICPNSFFSIKQNLDEHKKLYHPKEPKVFTCDLIGCTYKSDLGVNFYQHLLTHKEKYQCEQCLVICKTKIALQSHYELQHLQEYKFKCTACEQALKTRRLLNIHVLTHKIAQVCEGCGKEFTTTSTYKTHVNYTCPAGPKCSAEQIEAYKKERKSMRYSRLKRELTGYDRPPRSKKLKKGSKKPQGTDTQEQ